MEWKTGGGWGLKTAARAAQRVIYAPASEQKERKQSWFQVKGIYVNRYFT